MNKTKKPVQPFKAILVGDPHATPSSIADLKKLIDLIVAMTPPNVVFLGDQFHSHQVVYLEVMEFWRDSVKRLVAAGITTYLLVGNHDMSTGHNGDKHSLNSLRDLGAIIVDKYHDISECNVRMMPYMADFENYWSGRKEDLLICHHTFDGAKYENGFYAKNGTDQNLLDNQFIISGHIHTQMEIGKVWYPGTPRWMTINDANQDKGIWEIEWDGEKYTKKFHSTANIFEPIEVLEWKEGNEPPVPKWTSSKVTVNLRGTHDFLEAGQTWASEQKFSSRRFPTQSKEVLVNEARGVQDSWASFLSEFRSPNGTSGETINSRFRSLLERN